MHVVFVYIILYTFIISNKKNAEREDFILTFCPQNVQLIPRSFIWTFGATLSHCVGRPFLLQMGLHPWEGLSGQRYGHWVLGDDQSKGFRLPSGPGDGCGGLRLPFAGVSLSCGETAVVLRQRSLRLEMTNPKQTVYIKWCLCGGVTHIIDVLHSSCRTYFSIKAAEVKDNQHFCKHAALRTWRVWGA